MPGRNVDFDVVFEKHFSDIYGYVAFRLTPDSHAAQDLTQDVFMAGLRSWNSFRGETTALQWLRAIARRKIADYFNQHRFRVSTEALPDHPSQREDSTAWERAEMLSAVLREVPPQDAELLEEKYLEGLSIREMALQRGKTEKAIESALARARAAVRGKAQYIHTQREQ